MRGGMSHMQKGGDGGADWALSQYGNGQQQFDNTFGPGSNPSTGGILQPLPGASAVIPYSSGGDGQNGGRRRYGRKHGGTRRKRRY
jgi:hypothetical protein